MRFFVLFYVFHLFSLSSAGRRVATRPERRLNEAGDEGLVQVIESVWKDAGQSSIQQMTTSVTCTTVSSKSGKGSKSSRRLRRGQKQQQERNSLKNQRGLSSKSSKSKGSSSVSSLSCTTDTTVTVNCAAIANGSGSTAGASSTGQVLEFTFEILPGYDVDSVLRDVQSRLQTIFGPSFAGCSLNRRLQDETASSQVVNVVFDAPEVVREQACGDNNCVFAVIGNDIFYFGDNPEGFLAMLQDMIDAGLFDGIDGLAGVSIGFQDIAEPSDPTGGSGGEGSGGDGSGGDGSGGDGSGGDGSGGDGSVSDGDGSGSDGDGSGSDTDGDEPDGGFVGATTGDRAIVSDDGLGAGPAIGIAMGGLLVVFLLMLGRKKRKEQIDDSMTATQMKHRQLTDDEDDVENDIVVDPDSAGNITYLSAANPRVAHIVGEPNSVISTWSDNHTDASSDDGPNDEDGMNFHGKDEWCSSPNCELCEMKRMQGLRFVRTTTRSSDEGSGNAAISSDNRGYPAEDTIQL